MMERSHRLRPRETRRCTACGQVKPIIQFARDRALRNPEQRKYQCRECCNARHRQRFRQMSEEQYRAEVRANSEAKSRQRAHDREENIATARTCIAALRRSGYSTMAISRMTGCRYETIVRVERGESCRIQRATVAKITSALRSEMDRRVDP